MYKITTLIMILMVLVGISVAIFTKFILIPKKLEEERKEKEKKEK